MKKSVVLVSFVAIAIAGWFGSTWYSGYKIENAQAKYVALLTQQANVLMQSMDTSSTSKVPQVEFILDDYQRGFFSSQARYLIKEVGKPKPDQQIYFTANIEHGPMPLSELMSFRFTPVSMILNIELAKSESTNAVFEYTQGKSPFLLKIFPNRKELFIIPFKNDKFSFSGARLVLMNDKNFSPISLLTKIDNFTFSDDTSQLSINGLTFNTEFKAGKFFPYVGDQQINIQSMIVNVDKTEINLAQLDLQGFLHEDEQNIQYGFDVGFGKLKLAEHDFGSLKFAMKIGKIDGATYQELWKSFSANLNKPSTKTDNDSIINQNSQALLKNGAIFDFGPISWSNNSGTSQYQLHIELNKLSLAQLKNLDNLPPRQRITQLFNNFDSQLSISLPMAKELLRNSVAVKEGISVTEATSQADEYIQQMISLLDEDNGKAKFLIQIDNDKVTSHIQYSDDSFTVNGQTSPLSQLLDKE